MPMLPRSLCSVCHRAGCTGCARRRGSAHSRGYDKRWQRLRLRHLHAHPFCKDCGRLAEQVHHIVDIAVAPQRRLDPLNLMSLCASCHSKRTGAVKSPAPRPRETAGAQIVGTAGFRGIG